jgi:UDP-N-acetylglucosamine 2-epimerase (non-hydrolysing)
MSKLDILLIAGTRPNFIKLAPLYHQLSKADWCNIKVCHTGQHYDRNMSDVFWEYLQIPEPDYSLGISGGNVPDIIGNTMVAISKLLIENNFGLVIVFGDVNATAAGAIAATQLGIDVMHVEAGLRSFDRTMPEEVNRVITDHICKYLMVSEPSGLVNLKNEGISDEKVHFIGNIMMESLINTRPRWEVVELPEAVQPILDKEFVMSTFHRPENVDFEDQLKVVVKRLESLASKMPVVFPVHPRTKARLEKWNMFDQLTQNDQIILLPPLGYFEFINLISKSALVVTDSGGIQEETTYLQKPCVTIRKNTERPVTITEGTNVLMDLHDVDFMNKVEAHLTALQSKTLNPIDCWDNQVSSRIAEVIKVNF